MNNKANPKLQKIKQRSGLQAYVRVYLACIAFVDHQINRLLDALESSPYAKNTVIVLWSDHGYHLGENEIVMKFTPWQRSSRVPRLESPLL